MANAPVPQPTTVLPWMLAATERLGRPAEGITLILAYFIRGVPFPQVSADTGVSIADLNWLFQQPWRFSQVDAQASSKPVAAKLSHYQLRHAYLMEQVPRLDELQFSDEEIRAQLSFTRVALIRIRRELAGGITAMSVTPHEQRWQKELRRTGITVSATLGPEAAYRTRLRMQMSEAVGLWRRGWTIDRIGRRLSINVSSLGYFISELRRLGDGNLFTSRGIEWRGEKGLVRVAAPWDSRSHWGRTPGGRLTANTVRSRIVDRAL